MNNPDKTSSTLSIDEADHLRAAMLNLPIVPSELDDWSTQQVLKAKSSFIRIIGISLDPTQTGYDLALEMADFRHNRYFRYLEFSSFTKWCEKYNFSPRTISGYMKTFFDLSVDRSIDMEVYEHLSPGRVQKLLKPLLAKEPIRAKGKVDTDAEAAWVFWSWDLISILKGAK